MGVLAETTEGDGNIGRYPCHIEHNKPPKGELVVVAPDRDQQKACLPAFARLATSAMTRRLRIKTCLSRRVAERQKAKSNADFAEPRTAGWVWFCNLGADHRHPWAPGAASTRPAAALLGPPQCGMLHLHAHRQRSTRESLSGPPVAPTAPSIPASWAACGR